MADNVTNELLLEVLKVIQGKVADIASDIVDLKADVRDLMGHMAAFMQSVIAQDDRPASAEGMLTAQQPIRNPNSSPS